MSVPTPTPGPTADPSTWFVTGASRGLGLELVRALLHRGHVVAATTRSPERLTAALGDVDTAGLLALAVDLRDEQAVAGAVTATVERSGRLDVLVNNAGYGFLGAVEETSDAEVRQMFDVQVFGAWNVLRSALPVMRRQRSGHVVNVSSVLGLTAAPGWGAYCAAKFALEGLTEALAGEVADLGIAVSAVEPGYFRTSFLSESIALPATTSDGYEPVREMVRTHLAMPGTQLGDPVKGAVAIVDLVAAGGGRLRHLLGSDSYAYASAKVEALRADVEASHAVAVTTDFPQAA